MVLNFEQFLGGQCAKLDPEDLPVCHTTSEALLYRIIDTGKLQSNKEYDDFDNEKLIFFFYGKAEYMPREDAGDVGRVYSPVTFLFDFTKLSASPKRMLPFDSGAFNQYGLVLPVQYFEIKNPTKETLNIYITKVFGSYHEYYLPKINIEDGQYPYFTPINEIRRLFQLYGIQNPDFGHRAFTLELQIEDKDKQGVDLNPYMAFLPHKNSTEEVEVLGNLISSLKGVKIKFYGTGEESDSGERYRAMRNAVKKYILSKIINKNDP